MIEWNDWIERYLAASARATNESIPDELFVPVSMPDAFTGNIRVLSNCFHLVRNNHNFYLVGHNCLCLVRNNLAASARTTNESIPNFTGRILSLSFVLARASANAMLYSANALPHEIERLLY